MVIIYNSIYNELMVEIGMPEKSFGVSFMEIMLKGLKNILSEYFTTEEINDNFDNWYKELGQELLLREVAIEHNEKVTGNLNYSTMLLDNLPIDSTSSITLNKLNQYQKNLKEGKNLDISTDLFSNIDISNMKLSFKDKIINQVKQKHKTSCTIACLSMITGEPYDKVFKEIKSQYDLKRHFGTNEPQWSKYLENYGYTLGKKQVVYDWKNVPDYALCIVQGHHYTKNNSKDTLHAIVFRRQHGFIWLLDPGYEKPLYDFWNYNMTLVECYKIE